MMFLDIDRERLERVEKNLLSLYTNVAMRIDLELLVQKLDAIAESQKNLWQSHLEVCSAIGANQRELLESQGKLLAALNDLCALVNTSNEESCKRMDAIDSGLHETAMRNHQQLRAEFKAVQRNKGPRQ